MAKKSKTKKNAKTVYSDKKAKPKVSGPSHRICNVCYRRAKIAKTCEWCKAEVD